MHPPTCSASTVIYTLHDFYLSLLQWSFGVTCWEVFSAGKIPYGGVDPLTMIQLLESERRLDKPSNAACSEEM